MDGPHSGMFHSSKGEITNFSKRSGESRGFETMAALHSDFIE
jgi:hypothetical protein